MLAKHYHGAKQVNDANKMAGFGLIELLITIALMGILTTLAVSNFGAWIKNTKMRKVAESLQNGIRLAQTEAIKLNQSTTFSLTGNTWNIQAMQRGDTAKADTTIGTSGVLHVGAIADANTVSIDPASSTLRFNSMGRLVSPSTNVSYTISSATGSSADGYRRMQVSVSIAGRVRMCDPDKTLSANNPDGC